jgi:transposase
MEVDDGKSIERGSSVAGLVGFGRGHVGAASGGAVRRGVSSAIRWIARAKVGELAPRPQGRRRASSLDAYEAFIVGLIEERKDITLNEMVERLSAEHSVRISRSALSAWLRGHGWTFKKSPRTHWSRIAPTS